MILGHVGEFRDRVSLDNLAHDYEHAGCDHDSFCCITHRTQVMPRRCCMMR